MAQEVAQIDFPEPFQALFAPARYKVYYGGRGGAKTWNFARALLLLGMQRPLRVLCAREYQNSIAESVHKTLSDQIDAMGLNGEYEVLQKVIRGRPGTDAEGTEFFFEGIKTNTSRIKSYEGIDVCWIEEANNVSKASWQVIIPTIRKPGSEIWISFNPELEEDETYKRFVLNPPSNSVVKKVNWRDNPWFPEVLRDEMLELKERDYDAYLNVWEGHCVQVVEGAVYAKELRDALAQDRFTRVPYDADYPVHTFWDLGFGDMTSIWFAQAVGFEYRIIDFYQNRLEGLDHYLKMLQEKPYIYGIDWLPHDAKARQFAAAGRSVQQQMTRKGRKVLIVPRHRLIDGIQAARSIFRNCVFDAEACADGIQALRHYSYEVKDNGEFSREPKHDEHSHAADAFRGLAMSIRLPKHQRNEQTAGPVSMTPAQRTLKKFNQYLGGGGNDWMEM